MQVAVLAVQPAKSLPSRGAWIEIYSHVLCIEPGRVAPLAGSVDRNCFHRVIIPIPVRRSPRGERG